MEILDIDAFEIVQAANGRMEGHAEVIFRMAGQLMVAHRTTIQEAIRLAKSEWLRLLADSELAAAAAQPPHEQKAGQLALRLAEGRP